MVCQSAADRARTSDLGSFRRGARGADPLQSRDWIAVRAAPPLAGLELADDGVRVDPLAWL
jgi:hypothetical protein